MEDSKRTYRTRCAKPSVKEYFGGYHSKSKLSQVQLLTLNQYEAIDYLPPHTTIYLEHITNPSFRSESLSWVITALIGIFTGALGFLVYEFVAAISQFKWGIVDKLGHHLSMFIWLVCFGTFFAFLSSFCVVVIRPAAFGSGVPEIIGYLNGTVVKHIFNIRTMMVKFFSNVFAVGSGLPVGPEGPMIHMGSCLGAGIYGCISTWLSHAERSLQKCNYITAGAAAGLAAAFGAPIGGSLFAIEEVTSHWNLRLTWRIFFSCTLAALTVFLLKSSLPGFAVQHHFIGILIPERYILFKMDKETVLIHFWLFIPTSIIGIIGGLLGSLFTNLSLKLCQIKSKFINPYLRTESETKMFYVFEPCAILILSCTIYTIISYLFSCTRIDCLSDSKFEANCTSMYFPKRFSIGCRQPERIGNTESAIYVNEVHFLFLETGHSTISYLFHKQADNIFSNFGLLVLFLTYFPLAVLATNTKVAAGNVIPIFLIGSIIGRLIGSISKDVITSAKLENPFPDTGALALIGAAAFFSGVTRLTFSLTVIILEITNDMSFVIPIMLSVTISKWVGNIFAPPLYHALIDFRCIPFLYAEPSMHSRGKRINLEKFTVEVAMCKPVLTISCIESLGSIYHLITTTQHGGFPVVSNEDQQFLGTILASTLVLLLKHKELFFDDYDFCASQNIECKLSFKELQQATFSHLPSDDVIDDLGPYENFTFNKYINLERYIDRSALSVREHHSLYRAYMLVRSLGLRHLVVVNLSNQVVGLITRKDLISHSLYESIIQKSQEENEKHSITIL